MDVSRTARRRAVGRALRLLYALARDPVTFRKYGGHLLLAFYFIATTSADRRLRRDALAMGRERARAWHRQWRRARPRLDRHSILNQVYASHAARQMGIDRPATHQALQRAIARYEPRVLLGFDPARQQARHYEMWYGALIATYFCERHGLEIGATYDGVIAQLPHWRPYPRPGARSYRDAIYAVTHVVYTQNDYNRARLSPRAWPREFAFLKSSLRWALARRQADTVAEIVDSLLGFGLPDTHPSIVRGRRFLLETQRGDAGWGDEHDVYGRFHTVWTCIDALRDYGWPHAYARRQAVGDSISLRGRMNTVRANI